MDEERISKAARGQEIMEVTALDRSSVGAKGITAIGQIAEGSFRGGIENLSHSLKGVAAVQNDNGSAGKGRKGTVKYPSGD